MLANKDFWEGLSEADRALLQNMWEYSDAVTIHDQEYRTGEVLKRVQEEEGVTVTYLSSEDVAKFGAAALASVDRHDEDPYWVETMEILNSYMEQMGYK